MMMIVIWNLYSVKTINNIKKRFTEIKVLYLLKLKYSQALKTLELLKQSRNKNVLSCFLKMARLQLAVIVNGCEFHKTGAA